MVYLPGMEVLQDWPGGFFMNHSFKRELGFAPVSAPPSGRVRSGHVLVFPLHQSLQQPREPHLLQHLESGPQVAARSFRPCKHSFKPATAAKIAFNYCFVLSSCSSGDGEQMVLFWGA